MVNDQVLSYRLALALLTILDIKQKLYTLTFRRFVDLIPEPDERIITPFAIDKWHIDVEYA